MSKLKKEPERWAVGIDPGMKCTAAVLLADDVPIAAEAASNTDATEPIQQRVRMMATWLRGVIQIWINIHNIKTLTVLLELPFFNESPQNHDAPPGAPAGRIRSIKTFMVQMRQISAYEQILFDLRGAEVWLGVVHNGTAKSVFTGFGGATKDDVVARSVWAYRPELGDLREHLADAQAIGSVYPDLAIANDDALRLIKPKYMDHAIGQGAVWKPKKAR